MSSCQHLQEEDSGHAADSQKALAGTSETMTKASCVTCHGGYGRSMAAQCISIQGASNKYRCKKRRGDKVILLILTKASPPMGYSRKDMQSKEEVKDGGHKELSTWPTDMMKASSKHHQSTDA